MTTAEQGAPRGLGGWLILLALNIAVLLGAALFLGWLTLPLIGFELGRAKTFGAMLWPFVKYGPDLALGVALPVLVLALFARRSRGFPAMCAGFFAAWLALGLFDFAMPILEYWGVVPLANWFQWRAIRTALIGLGLNVTYLAVWTTYLRRSRRVANTFVR